MTDKAMTENMKLAEALLLRSDLQKQLLSLKARLAENAKVQDGDLPGESPGRALNSSKRAHHNLVCARCAHQQNQLKHPIARWQTHY